MINKFTFLLICFGFSTATWLSAQTVIDATTINYDCGTPGTTQIEVACGFKVDVAYEIWGGGGAGGRHNASQPLRSASGGGGGGYSTGMLTLTAGVHDVVCGAGGVLVDHLDENRRSGEDSGIVGFIMSARGIGSGGGAGVGGGGAGTTPGGDGGARNTNNGGGGGGGSGLAVTDGDPGTGAAGGDGGLGTAVPLSGGDGGDPDANGLDGNFPGGGGGGKGAGTDLKSGNGANGQVLLTFSNYGPDLINCYPTSTLCANMQPGTPNTNPASCNISAGEPTAVITIPAFDCADATAVTFETPVLPTTSSVLYHYWGNCAPNSPPMPENISAKSNGYIQQMFCETDGFGLPAFPGGLSGEFGTINFLPQASEDVGSNGFAAVGTCDGGGVGTDEKEAELIQLDFWMGVPDIQSQVGFRFSTNNREDAASFFVGADLNAMCEVAYFTDGQNHDGLFDQFTGTFNIAPGQLTGTCGLLWMRVRVYINDISDQFEVNPQIDAGAGWVDVDQLLIEPAVSASDNTIPTITTTTISGYLIEGEFVYDDGGAWAPYGCNPVVAATDDGVCMLVVTDVELSAFNVTAKKETAVLDWTTVSETNSDKFIIERSHNGRSFSSIGEVKSNGNSKEEINYQLIDTRPLNGKSYYRLHEVSFDGTSDYSKIVSVDFTSKTNIEIYPNPASDQLFWKNVTEDLNYKMMNVHGQEVSSGLVNKSTEGLDLSTLIGGLYFMKIYNQNNEMTQIVKVYVH